MVQAKTQTTEANNAKDATQSELDDLLMVFGDLEDKVNKYKVWAERPKQTNNHVDFNYSND